MTPSEAVVGAAKRVGGPEGLAGAIGGAGGSLPAVLVLVYVFGGVPDDVEAIRQDQAEIAKTQAVLVDRQERFEEEQDRRLNEIRERMNRLEGID